MQITFADRYTGDPRGRPTEFNACRGGCQAMGVYPVKVSTREIEAAGSGALPEADEDGDAWISCAACGGTGRVPLWRGLLRVPRWLVKGLRFIWDTNVGCNRGCRAPWHTRRQHLSLTFKCAYLVDLGLWSPG